MRGRDVRRRRRMGDPLMGIDVAIIVAAIFALVWGTALILDIRRVW